jgi:hypothetical protein
LIDPAVSPVSKPAARETVAPGSTLFKLCPIVSPEHRLDKMKCCRLRLLNFLACVGALIGVNIAAAAENLRYLFLIDHSPDMATRQLATVQTVYDLVHSGFDGQIQPGEKFALWFYGSRLQMNPPFTWQAGHEIELARYAANLFTGRIYSRLRPREQTLADAAPYIAASPKITIFIFTDGTQPIAGTPYDSTINNAIDSRRMLFRSADKPMIITITAKNGELVGSYVQTDVNQPFKNPELELPSEVLNKALAAVRSTPSVKTNNPAEIDKALAALRMAPAPAPRPNQNDAGEIDKARDALRDALAGKTKPADTNAPIPVEALQLAPALKEPPPEAPKEKPKQEEPKIEKAQPQVAAVPPLIAAPKPQEQKTDPPPQKVEPPPTKPVEVASVPSPAPAPPIKTAEPPPVVREEPKPVVKEERKIVREEPKPVVQQPAPEIIPKPSLEPAKKEQNKPAQTNAVISKPKPQPTKTSPPVQTAAVTPPKSFPWPILTVGLALIAGLGAVALLSARRRGKSPGSIITQALPRSGMPPHRK